MSRTPTPSSLHMRGDYPPHFQHHDLCFAWTLRRKLRFPDACQIGGQSPLVTDGWGYPLSQYGPEGDPSLVAEGQGVDPAAEVHTRKLSEDPRHKSAKLRQ